MAEKKSHSTLLVQTTSLCLFVVVVVVFVVGRGGGLWIGVGTYSRLGANLSNKNGAYRTTLRKICDF